MTGGIHWRPLIGAACTLLTLAACGDDPSSGDGEHMQAETSPCFEWQRFMRHAGLDMAQVAEGNATGEVVFSEVGFLHAGSWELNFRAAAGGEADMFQFLLCVDGSLPFEQCFDDDPSNDEDCDKAIDARCRGDEHRVGSLIDGHMGKLKAELVSVDPDPPTDGDPTTVTIRLLDTSGQPLDEAMVSRAECSKGMMMHHAGS